MHVIEIDYTAPLTEIDAALDAHKNWLDCQYAAGLFLVSGGKDPRAEGIIIAADMPRDMIIAAVSTDPFAVRGLARRRIIRFLPSRVSPPHEWTGSRDS